MRRKSNNLVICKLMMVIITTLLLMFIIQNNYAYITKEKYVLRVNKLTGSACFISTSEVQQLTLEATLNIEMC